MTDYIFTVAEQGEPGPPTEYTGSTLAYGGTTAYQVLATDAIVIFDASGWTNQAALVATLPPTPLPGERHAFYWDGWVVGAPPPIVSGGSNPIVPYAQNVQTSKARAQGNATAITDFGGSAAWVWTGSVWVPG